jgi:hypothetical protein
MSTPPEDIVLADMPPPSIAITSSTGSEVNLEHAQAEERSEVNVPRQSATPSTTSSSPSRDSTTSTNPSRTSALSTEPPQCSTPSSPSRSELGDASPQSQPRSCSIVDSRSDTLVASSVGHGSRRATLSPTDSRQENDASPRPVYTFWRQPIFAPWSSMWLANIIAICVCAITIMTLIYSHRGDVSQRWNNLAALKQVCLAENVSRIDRPIRDTIC